MPQQAPRRKIDRPADKAKSFAAGVGAVALDAQAGPFPNFGPQYTEAHNNNNAATQSAVFTLEDGTTLTVVVGPNETRRVHVPVKALSASSGADISFVCYWWVAAGPDDFNYLATINP